MRCTKHQVSDIGCKWKYILIGFSPSSTTPSVIDMSNRIMSHIHRIFSTDLYFYESKHLLCVGMTYKGIYTIVQVSTLPDSEAAVISADDCATIVASSSNVVLSSWIWSVSPATGRADNSLQIVSSSVCDMISISSLVEVLGNSISAFDHCTVSAAVSSTTLLGRCFFFF